MNLYMNVNMNGEWAIYLAPFEAWLLQTFRRPTMPALLFVLDALKCFSLPGVFTRANERFRVGSTPCPLLLGGEQRWIRVDEVENE